MTDTPSAPQDAAELIASVRQSVLAERTHYPPEFTDPDGDELLALCALAERANEPLYNRTVDRLAGDVLGWQSTAKLAQQRLEQAEARCVALEAALTYVRSKLGNAHLFIVAQDIRERIDTALAVATPTDARQEGE